MTRSECKKLAVDVRSIRDDEELSDVERRVLELAADIINNAAKRCRLIKRDIYERSN